LDDRWDAINGIESLEDTMFPLMSYLGHSKSYWKFPLH